jgi:dynein intermediate chain 1, axonemal
MPSKMLVPINPIAPKNITNYSFKDHRFITDELVDQLQIHFSYEG